MTAIEAVGTFLPPVTVSASQSLQEFGFSEKQSRIYERFYGFSDTRLDPGGGLTDQLVAAASGLAALRGQEHRVRYVMHARTMPVVAPYPSNPLREACEQLNLDHATAFSVTQHACASALLAVDMAGKLLAEDPDPDALALVFIADKSFTACEKAVVWAGVMGECAAAILVKTSGERDRMLSYVTKTYGRFCEGPWMPEDKHEDFRETYPQALAEVIDASIRDAGLTLDDIALILPHNVNRLSWTRVLKALGIPGSKRLYLDNQASLGHCFGADSFVNYESAVASGRIRPGDHYLMTAVGLGATFSAMVFTH
jgi:3-oxoacyl-[acyl-carrier-protein] synthase III